VLFEIAETWVTLPDIPDTEADEGDNHRHNELLQSRVLKFIKEHSAQKCIPHDDRKIIQHQVVHPVSRKVEHQQIYDKSEYQKNEK
jgi:hypothetical protein